MDKLFYFLLQFFCLLSTDIYGQAWIEENFANGIMNEGKIDNRHLFPIEGFEYDDNQLWVVSYGMEPYPIGDISIKEGTIYRYNNYGDTFNRGSWPEDSIAKYENACLEYSFSGDTLVLLLKTEDLSKSYRYIHNLQDSRFSNLYEIKGWLLDCLMKPLFDKPKQFD